MTKRLALLLMALTVLTLGGCAATPPPGGPDRVAALAKEIEGLGPNVDPAEAARAARIAYSYSMQLKAEYGVTDSPIIHNVKVHNGERQRGLCNHWAEDLHRRLSQEGFRTLDMRRAISPRSPFRIIHHSAVITPRGQTIYEGVILDPWRHGGPLFWGKTTGDDRYNWRPREEIIQEFMQARDARAG
ncbi:hypothetical protein [Antarctobacter jejuensis]|uniref:hypothetical protein n=1 Tax=Antarctobacter jejuensis TaxID=1439938 RepID=UPI003FD2B1B2